jgi:hypothetical protein
LILSAATGLWGDGQDLFCKLRKQTRTEIGDDFPTADRRGL